MENITEAEENITEAEVILSELDTITKTIADEKSERPLPAWLVSLKGKVPEDCGKDRLPDRIWNGNIVPVGEHPWVVMIEYQKRKQDK